MFEKYSAKGIIAINLMFHKGTLINESSLNFAIDQANKSGSWLKACALLVRAVLIDHVFEDGNKRTAAGIIVGFFDENSLPFHPEKVSKCIVTILLKNIVSITKIERLIKDALI